MSTQSWRINAGILFGPMVNLGFNFLRSFSTCWNENCLHNSIGARDVHSSSELKKVRLREASESLKKSLNACEIFWALLYSFQLYSITCGRLGLFLFLFKNFQKLLGLSLFHIGELWDKHFECLRSRTKNVHYFLLIESDSSICPTTSLHIYDQDSTFPIIRKIFPLLFYGMNEKSVFTQ